MGHFAAVQDGPADDPTTYGTGGNTPTIHATANVPVTTGGVFGAAYTAPSASDSCVGIFAYVQSKTSLTTLTCTLQESTVDKVSQSIAMADVLDGSGVASGFVFFKFATAYPYTTTGAGAYRPKFTGSSNNGTLAADSGGTLVSYLVIDSRTGVPGSGDNLWSFGANGSGTVTVTLDSDATIGNDGQKGNPSARSYGNAINAGEGGLFTIDHSASRTLTLKGTVMSYNGGEFRCGTTASRVPAANTINIVFSPTANGDYGFHAPLGGKITMAGATRTSYITTYASGLGTAASPLIFATALDVAVNDQLVIEGTGSAAQAEHRYVINVNSPTSVVVSSTLGGAETALVNTHAAGSYIINLTRNIVIKSDNSARSHWLGGQSRQSNAFNLSWVRSEYGGYVSGNANSTAAFSINSLPGYSVVGCVAYQPLFQGFNIAPQGDQSANTFTDIVVAGGTNAGATGIVLVGGFALAPSGMYVIDNQGGGISASSADAYVITRPVAINTGKGTSQNAITLGGSAMTVNDPEVLTAGTANAFVLNGVDEAVINNLQIGHRGVAPTNGVLAAQGNIYNTATFNYARITATNRIALYTGSNAGSRYGFHALDGDDNKHAFYTRYGSSRSTGPGLADTTTVQAGELSMLIAPESLSPGERREFLIDATAGNNVGCFGFARKNTAFGSSVCTVELFLPGSTAADSTYTLTDAVEQDQVWAVNALYSGTVDGLATVRFTAKSTTPAAYVYVGKIYNGTNAFTSLAAWKGGLWSGLMSADLRDPSGTWNVLTATFTTPGTVGYLVVRIYRLAKFLRNLLG